MPYADKANPSIEEIADGLIAYIKKYMIANTFLTQDALAGDTVLHVDNSLRFKYGDEIVLFDNDAVFQPGQNTYEGIELHTVASDPETTSEIILSRPLGRTYTTSTNGRIMKAIRGAILLEKDVLYGDREVIPFNQVAICVEPDSVTGDWVALRLLSNEFRISIMVYVKPRGGSSDEDISSGQEWAARVCHAYASELYGMFLDDIHIDINVEEAPLVADAAAGDSWVYISDNLAEQWPADDCARYEVQDNFHSDTFIALLASVSSSSSLTSLESLSSLSIDVDDSSSSQTELSSSQSLSSESSSSDSSSSVNSSSSSGRSSSSSQSSQSTGSSSSESSESSLMQGAHMVYLSKPLLHNYRVSDKAVLRRNTRHMYDSRASTANYGDVQKQSAILKGARLEWFGKEAQGYSFPQVGKGGSF